MSNFRAVTDLSQRRSQDLEIKKETPLIADLC